MVRIICFCVAALAAARSPAALVISIQPTTETVKVGLSGSFEMLVTSTNFMPTTIDYYRIKIDAPGLAFTSINGSGLSQPYARPSGTGASATVPLPSDSTMTYGDQIPNLFSVFEPSDPIFNGETKSLGRVSFNVPPGTPIGTVPVTLGLADFREHDIFIPGGVTSYPTAASPGPGSFLGSISVAAIPEPSDLALLTLAVLLGGGGAWQRRKKVSTQLGRIRRMRFFLCLRSSGTVLRVCW